MSNGYTYDEVSDIAGVTKATVMGWKRNGCFDTVKSTANKKIVLITSTSLISFLVDKKNKRYFESACINSKLFHGNDFSKLIEQHKQEQSGVVDSGAIKHNHSVPKNSIMPKYKNHNIIALSSIMDDVNECIKRVDDAIAGLTSTKGAYAAAKSDIERHRNEYTPDEYEKKIGVIKSHITGLNSSIEILKSIKRGYVANVSVIKLTIETDSKISF